MGAETQRCPDPRCHNGWIENSVHGGRRACRSCGVNVPPVPRTATRDDFTGTVDGARAHARSLHRDPFGRYQ